MSRKRANIHAMISVEIVGDDDEEIAERFADALVAAHDNTPGVMSVTVSHSETTDVPFVIPKGAERWPYLAEFRFGEDCKIAPMHDGSWWWTDGHAMFRCEGEPPEGWRKIEDALTKQDHFRAPEQPVVWSTITKRDRDGLERRISQANDLLSIQTKYHDAVMISVPHARWTSGPDHTHTTRAYDNGQLVAVVMPCKRGDPPTEMKSKPEGR